MVEVYDDAFQADVANSDTALAQASCEVIVFSSPTDEAFVKAVDAFEVFPLY